MRRLLLAPSVLLLLVLGACSSGDDDAPDASPAPAASQPAPAPASEPGSAEPGADSAAALQSVTDDANRVTPPLESYFFDVGPADDLDGAVEALATIGLELSPGNTVGSYVYDQADEDFRLCIQGTSGAFATYDTSPMSLFETGESGGCP